MVLSTILINFYNISLQLWYNQLTRKALIGWVAICAVLYTFLSWKYSLLLYLYGFLGFLTAFLLIEYQNTSRHYLETFLQKFVEYKPKKRRLTQSCSVCDGLSCKRHKAKKAPAPWQQLSVSVELNEALASLYNRILSEFVSLWYCQFTQDAEFVNELRFCLKYASASLVNRILDTDYIHLIGDKLLAQVTKHVDDYFYMQQIAKLKNVKYEEVIVEYLGKNLHAATTSRSNELDYLRNLSKVLVKKLLPSEYVKCRNYAVLLRELLAGWVLLPLMDALADPNLINYLVILGVNYKSNKTHTELQQNEFLKDFCKFDSLKKSPFSMSLNKIKNDTTLFYALMQFLKREEQVHLLQFCLDVDNFNTTLLTPDLTKKQLEELLVQATNLHKEYLNESSFNFIGCSKSISDEFKELIGDIYSVAKLRTSKPLYQAYDLAFNQLDLYWLPQFFHSNEFYSCLCGSKVTSTYNTLATKKKYDGPSGVTSSKLSSGLGKIKGVLKSNVPIDGALDLQDSDFIEDNLIMRDLSNWRVEISSHEVTDKKVVRFRVNVLHVDVDGKINAWTILRRDQDFFTLKAKLIEFHGESEICDSPLPSRKAGVSLESRKSKYEIFLAKLLRKPSLRGSDLLHTFLTSEEDFTLVISAMAPNTQDIGNIYQSVANKLRKERGQHLDNFINNFVSSAMKQRLDKIDVAEEGTETITIPPIQASLPKTFNNPVFKNNFSVSWYKRDSTDSTGGNGGGFRPTELTESLFYLLKHLFKVNPIWMKVYTVICNYLRPLVNSLSMSALDYGLKLGLNNSNLAVLVRALEGAIFNPRTLHSQEEYAERKRMAFEDVRMCPQIVEKVCGGKVNEGLVTLLEILQNPLYNKQLSYNLLDILVVELFPEVEAN